MSDSTETAPADREEIPEEEWLTPAEAAELVGCHLETIRRWIRSGALPAQRNPRGRMTRVRRSDVLQAAHGGKATTSVADRLSHDRPSQIITPGQHTVLIEG